VAASGVAETLAIVAVMFVVGLGLWSARRRAATPNANTQTQGDAPRRAPVAGGHRGVARGCRARHPTRAGLTALS